MRAAHYATSLQGPFSGRAPAVRFVNANVGPGARGQSVRLLQSELDALHYAVPLTGFFEGGTARALIAYRKMTGLERASLRGPGGLQLGSSAEPGASRCATGATAATSRPI